MEDNDSLFTDKRNLLFVKKPDAEDAQFEYIFLHNDEKEKVKFVACFNLELSCFEICKFENLPPSSDLCVKWETFFTESLEAKKKKQVYHTQIDGKRWKRTHIQGLLNNYLLNCFGEFRKNIINQNNKSKNEAVKS